MLIGLDGKVREGSESYLEQARDGYTSKLSAWVALAIKNSWPKVLLNNGGAFRYAAHGRDAR